MAKIRCDELGLNITFRYGYIHGRRSTAAYLEADDGRWWGGLAECSRKDRFVKDVGRRIALGRAAVRFAWYHVQGREPLPCTEEMIVDDIIEAYDKRKDHTR
jgi:hypothetical protein